MEDTAMLLFYLPMIIFGAMLEPSTIKITARKSPQLGSAGDYPS
jgi:hypothetical protein